MWENYRARNIVRQVFLFLLCVVLGGGLVYGLRYVNRYAAAQEEANVAAYKENTEAQTAVKEELLARLQADYQEDLDVVAQYLPGIVCWGDAITAGSVSGVSYASALQALIDENIVDAYNFRSTLDYASSISRVTWEDYTVDVEVVNMGSGAEPTGTILGRSGAAPYILSQELVIPSACEPVRVYFTAADGAKATPLTAGDCGINNVTIAGVEGTLTLDSEQYRRGYYYYYFTRSEAGSETTVPVGTTITTGCADLYKDYISVIFIGTYGGFADADEMVRQFQTMVERQTGLTDRYIVISPYYYTSYYETLYDGGSTYQFNRYEKAMEQAFGDHFLNIRKYLATDALEDAGMSPTTDDTKAMKEGRIPNSLRASNTYDSTELSSTGYQLIGRLIYDRMDKLGYFTEVREALGLVKTATNTAKS